MEVYMNNLYSLPQQVENNRENIEILFNSIQNGSIVKSSEILLRGAWTRDGDLWKQTVTIPNMTKDTFTLTVCESKNTHVLYDFMDIVMSNSVENGVEYYANEKPNLDILIGVWYNVNNNIDN